MKNQLFNRALIIISTLVLLFWLPFFVIILKNRSNIVQTIDLLPSSDAVIIFGTLVNESGDISPLLKERLDAGKAVFDAGKAQKIVVSNTPFATNIMTEYLLSEGVDDLSIEKDQQAETTPDTCRFEKTNHSEPRDLIFVSQGFHLPRLLYQCKKLSVEGIGFAAEAKAAPEGPEYSFFTKVQVRTKRYIREATLTWLAFLRIY